MTSYVLTVNKTNLRFLVDICRMTHVHALKICNFDHDILQEWDGKLEMLITLE